MVSLHLLLHIQCRVFRDEYTNNPLATFTTPPLPPKTALAVFSIPGDDEAKYSPLKTYALYQDSDAKIQMMWRNDTSGWNGPKTFSAFKGADNGTSQSRMRDHVFVPGAVDGEVERAQVLLHGRRKHHASQDGG